jgi:hypothetical protein
MGCTSAGTEADAGTLYPTLMQDTNGNQNLVRCHDWYIGWVHSQLGNRDAG